MVLIKLTIGLVFLLSTSASQINTLQKLLINQKGNDLIFENSFDTVIENTAEQLIAFYAPHGGQAGFPQNYINSIETLLYAQDDIVLGNYSSARSRIDAILSAQPLSTDIWWNGFSLYDLNVGTPIAYYGIRMLDYIADVGNLPSTGTLNFTAVIATCATVTRPTLPNLDPETVQLNIDNAILANNYKILFQATDLFRHWVKAITGGYELRLSVIESPICTTVDYTLGDGVIVSYPNANAMVNSLPQTVINQTDLWWVIAPSGVPGDGSEYDDVFITGGMGLYSNGSPLILSDDGWFIRKPAHLGQGLYSEVERRVYQPQWFQHEFMHHLFRTWPEFGLEDTSHQWFDRNTWPKDFVGVFEPDYYSEAINKRLITAKPSLAEGLKLPSFANFDEIPLSIIAGDYERLPVQNEFHQISITVDNETTATWSNAANVSWSLFVNNGSLFSAASSPYGEQPLQVLVSENNQVQSIIFLGEPYIRLQN
ncbi:MAG: hypothetical protein AB8B80_04570 [Marinicellaceae bacterium]